MLNYRELRLRIARFAMDCLAMGLVGALIGAAMHALEQLGLWVE